MPRVNIDGIEYAPASDLFRLTDSHFEAAAGKSNAFEMIRWAHDCQASVDEMRAWGNANRADAAPAKPKRVTSLFT